MFCEGMEVFAENELPDFVTDIKGDIPKDICI